MEATLIEVFASACLGIAVLHTFLVKQFERQARKYPEGSVGENFFHLLAEVEIVMGFWAGVLVLGWILIEGRASALSYIESLSFTEPLFVFVVMAVSASKPILGFANRLISWVSRGIPAHASVSFYFCAMTLGPALGSLITEPAAMTVTALVLKDLFFDREVSNAFRYATIGLLFVNVSIGGTFTHYAAPPVLMVAGTWGWDSMFMFEHFGWKAGVSMVVSTLIVVLFFRKEIVLCKIKLTAGESRKTEPAWMTVAHLLVLLFVVLSAHHSIVFLGVFLFFLWIVKVTQEYQEPLKLRESLLVAFFLGGLVVLGGAQKWWLGPLLAGMGPGTLFVGSIALTSVTDNAALTYLGSLVPNLSELAKYALLAGAVTGGGLTVIANAPNPVGFGVLHRSFGPGGISPLGLFVSALGPTIIASLCFWFLPSI